jgi:hypothetical protein
MRRMPPERPSQVITSAVFWRENYKVGGEIASVTMALTRATFVEPMRRLEAEETYKPVRIGEYVGECIAGFDPPLSREHLEIEHVYLNGDRSFYHVLIHYGRQNEFLVIVVDCSREAVHGHYLLDVNREYGLRAG